MRRRSKTGGEPGKTRHRKIVTLKRRNAPKAVRRRSSSAAGKEAKVALFKRERDEAQQQQAATAEVLKVISRSTFDLQTVFKTIIANAVRLCHAHMGAVHLFDGKLVDIVAFHNFPPEAVKVLQSMYPRPPQPDQASGRAILTGKVAEIEDMLGDPQYTRKVTVAGQWGSILAVPMLRDGAPIGAIVITRNEVGRFADRHVELLKTFADQAGIAIENTRLLNELRQRTDDLSESLERQTATSKVLEVISSSPGDLKPVFESILANAVRLCGAKFGNLYLREGDGFRAAAMHNAPSAYAAQRAGIVHRSPYSTVYQAAHTKQPAQTADITKLPGYLEGDPWLTSAVSLGGYRGVLSVPMLHEDESIGTITIFRQEAEAFANKQIELLTNFAKQAVIAIENARLLNELRQSLDQQTAMAEVLGVISGSPGDLQPVFDNMLRNAVRICDAKFGMLLRFDGEAFHMAAEVDLPPDYAEFEKRRGSFLPPAGTLLDRVMKTKRVSYTADMAADAAAASPARRGGARSAVTVPMLKDDKLIGAILIYRQEVQPFADKQITLVQNFAAQAVIAIENTRLLNELRQSLEQQTATADVLRVISSSPGELEPVFQAMMENAVRICDAKFGTLFRFDGKMFNFAADVGSTPEFVEFERRRGPFQPTPGSHLERVMRTKRVSHTADYAAEGVASPPMTLGGARSTVDVPMLKDNELIGVLSIYRQEVRPFTDKQIELLQNFAAQAVIAIENTRLLNELRESLEQQTATADVLRVISSSPGDLEPVFQAMLENAVRICEAKFGALFRFDGEH